MRVGLGSTIHGHGEPLFKPGSDVVAIVKLCTYPIPMVQFRRLIRRASTAERIKNDVVRLGRNQDCPFGNDEFQFIHSRPDFEFLVTIRRGVLPEVRQIETRWIEFVPVAAVILQLLTTMATSGNGNPNPVEDLRSSARVVEQGIVCRIEFAAARVGPLHRERNPVPKREALIKIPGEVDAYLRGRVHK